MSLVETMENDFVKSLQKGSKKQMTNLVPHVNRK